MKRQPQVSMTHTDLIVAIPLENIPNMPPDPAGRAQALQHIRLAIAHHAAQGGGAAPGASPVMGALNAMGAAAR